MELEYCSDCGNELEVGQIGKCDDCQKRRRRFVAVKRAVMLGDLCVGKMLSKTMAKRAANALNKHVPNREGV